MLIRSGLSILMDHPRLYFNNGCTPGTESIRFTPLKVPKDRVWRASDDDRYISPIFALPGYRHSVGHRTFVAFHRCIWIHCYRPDFHPAALRLWSMGQAGSYFVGNLAAGLGDLRALCEFPLSTRAGRLLRL